MIDEGIERIAALALRKIAESKRPIALPEGPAPRRSDSRFHQLAAVVSSFRPEELRKLDPESREFDALLSDAAPVEDLGAPGQWTLLPSSRAAVLSRMTAEQLREAATASGVITENRDPLARALEVLSRPGTPALDELDIPALVALSPITPSLREVLENAPERAEVERRLEFLRILQPFERLVGRHFAGRTAELQTLSDYVGVLPPGSTIQALSRIVFTRKAPLLVWGVGGVGKSTLIAKFILAHATLPEGERFPFAYLDFDRPSLLAAEPATILVEAVRQIGLQYPVAYAAAQRLHEQWSEQLQSGAGRVAATRGQKSPAKRPRTKQAAGIPDSRTRERIVKDFVQFLGTLEVLRGPLLLILDTFEEVQHRSDVHVRELVKFLEDLSRDVPRLRTVLSGRAAVAIELAGTIELKDFDDAAAMGFLMQKEQGITDERIARAIVKQVGGNPLTLRLAAAVAREDGATFEGIGALETHGAFGLIRVKKSHIQGQLFKRILDHIHDEDVVKIAHPGLVLRRITPDLIQKVLAKPCGIDVPTKARAQELFAKLQKEVALVSPAGADVLEHRADVRRLMLGPLRETRPLKTREIDELAAAYYAEVPGVIARAEEIYHRLVLAEPHEEIAAMFLDGVEDYLGSALEELAAPEKAFLAERLGVELPPEDLAGATQQVWERTAIRKIEEALAAQDWNAALAVLAERPQRSAQTMLRVHEVEALTEAERFEDAERVGAQSLDAYAAEGNLLGVFEMELTLADLSRRRGRVTAAMETLAEAEAIAQSTRNALHLIRVLVARALVMEGGSLDAAPTQAEIVEKAAKIDDDSWRDYPVLLRLAAALSMDRELLARAIRLTGIPLVRSHQQDALRSYFQLPLDEEGLLTLIENPPPPSGSFVTKTIAELLRNDTYAEVKFQEKVARADSLGLDVSLEEVDAATSQLPVERKSLQQMLGSLEYSLESLTFERDPRLMLRNVIGAALAGGWLAALLDVLRKNYWANAPFLRFADRLGIGITAEQLRGDSLQRKSLEELLDARRVDLALIESRICRIERENRVTGTGFLVGDDLVLTCADAIAGGLAQARFDAGEKDGKRFTPGTLARILRTTILGDTADPRAAVIQLDRPVALEPVQSNVGGKPRGAFSLRESQDAALENQHIVWLWHERGLRLGGSEQIVHSSPDEIGFPIRPRDAFRGAPCFDLALNLVAVHCGAHRRIKRDSLARPLTTIAAELMRLS